MLTRDYYDKDKVYMKISHFPDFWPDETVFSVCSRYLDRMQFDAPNIVSQHFFGRPRMSGLRDLPPNLEHIVQALPPYNIYTVDKIIDQHTHFLLYAHFLPSERAYTLRQNMKGDGSTVFNINTAGARRSWLPSLQWLRYCPECVNDDRLTYGECYWHRLHQISWVLVCPVHEIMLEDSTVNLAYGNKIAQFYSAERAVQNIVPYHKAPQHLYTVLQQLASNTKWLLEQSSSEEIESIQRQYVELLMKRGFITSAGGMRLVQLREAMLDYYPVSLLEDLGCGIKSRGSWLESWRHLQHPLHHLLLIQFLSGTCQEFFIHPPKTPSQNLPKPFGSGPWPCLNPLCPSYKEQLITTYTLRQEHKHVGIFTCTVCGFSYSRTGPERDDDAPLRGRRVLQYGSLWDQCLTTYWLNKDLCTAEIARLMHTTFATVIRQAARLGLPFAPDLLCRGNRPKIYQDILEEQRNFYRSMVINELKSNPDMKLYKVSRKAYHWFQRHDFEWLKKHTHNDDISLKQKRLMSGKTQQRQNNYSLVDAEWAKIVRQTAEDFYSRSDFPVQVTLKQLLAPLGHSILFNKSNDVFESLPLTSQALDEVQETPTAFIWRKLRWAVGIYLGQQLLPSYFDFLRRVRLSHRLLDRPIIQQLVQSAYASLCAGVWPNAQLPERCFGNVRRRRADEEDNETITNDSLMAACVGQQLVLPNTNTNQSRRNYNILSLMLITVAAVVYGAENVYNIEKWINRNEDLICWIGIPEMRFPGYDALQRAYAILNTELFENILELWLDKNFPKSHDSATEVKVPTPTIYVPGLKLLQPYRHIASTIVAKLR